MQFSVVIPTYNSAASLGRTLASLKEFFDAGDEVLVIDDQSRDASPEIARQYPTRLDILPKHSGPAAARNRGVEIAGHSRLLFLDSDVVCGPGIRRKLETCMVEQDAVQGIYAPISHDENPITKYQNNYYHYVFHRISGKATAVCATFFFGIKRELFLQTGGFDETITDPTVEDEKLGYALHEQGKMIRVCSELQVLHLARYSTRHFLTRRFTMAQRQSQAFLRRRGEAGLFSFLALNASRKTHHTPSFLLAVALLPCAYVALLLGWVCQSVPVMALGTAGFVSLFLLNTGLLRTLIRLSGKDRFSMPLIFFFDLHILAAGIACGFFQREWGTLP